MQAGPSEQHLSWFGPCKSALHIVRARSVISNTAEQNHRGCQRLLMQAPRYWTMMMIEPTCPADQNNQPHLPQNPK